MCKMSILLTHHTRGWSHHARWWAPDRHARWTRLLWPHLRRSWHLWSSTTSRSHYLLGGTAHTSDWALKTCNKMKCDSSVLIEVLNLQCCLLLDPSRSQHSLLADKNIKLKVCDLSSHTYCFITASRLMVIHYDKFAIMFGIFQTIHWLGRAIRIWLVSQLLQGRQCTKFNTNHWQIKQPLQNH